MNLVKKVGSLSLVLLLVIGTLTIKPTAIVYAASPTATIVVADTALKVGETSLVTITFSEAVTGFDNVDLTIANGILSPVSSSDGGVTWTGTFTPTASVTDATNVITLDNTGVQDGASNAGTGTTSSNNYAIDTARPTATIVVADTALRVGETSLVTITFSEAVTGFDNVDLTIANGILSPVSSSDGGVTWTGTFTPTASVTDATNVITLDNTGVQDGASNAGTGTTSSNNYAIDTARPTATIVVADNALAVGETSLVTIIFSEAVLGFTNADLSVSNGTLSSVSSSDGFITWTATLAPNANITDTSNLITLDNTGVADLSGNTGVGITDSNNYVIDAQRPTATIVVADSTLTAGETSLVTITFSEAVTGFTNTDLSVPNGTLSAFSSSDGGVTWTATLTPDANITDASNVITLNNSGVQDAAGNAGTGTTSSNNYAIDTARPTATIVVADNALAVGETSLVTIIFSEAVSGFTNVDLTIANGTLSAVSSQDGGVTWTATLTPTANITDASNVITLDNTGVQNIMGNTGLGTTDSNNYWINTVVHAVVRPTATIVVADTLLTAGETSLVTITFSEAVSSFTNADLTIANGTLSTVSSSDGGVTWTATFTPTANIIDASNVITLYNTGVQNGVGNTGLGTTSSNNYSINTVVRPTATILVADTMLTAGETSLVKIIFSEAVMGFDNGDLTIANGTLSTVSSSDGGVTWTATFTPQANISLATNQIKLNNSGVYNSGGIAGQGITESNKFSIFTEVTTGGSNSINIPDNVISPIPPENVITSINGKITLPIGTSGVVSLGEKIIISIPKGASSRKLEISIEKLTNIEAFLRNKEVLATPMFEIKKNIIENLNKPVKLSVEFDSKNLKSNETVALFNYDELKKSWVKVDGGLIIENQLTVEINQFSKYAVLVVDKTTGMPIIDTTVEIDFSDTSEHWAKEEIEAMFARDIIKGYLDGTFKPNDPIKREHVAVMLTRALELNPIHTARTFSDVSTSSPYYDAISKLQLAGIIDGTNGAFHPQASMTRAQMAKVLVLALGFNTDGKTTFRDVPEKHWAYVYIAALEEYGITLGDNGNFNPNEPVTRAQFSAFLYRALNLQK
ncbi:Ig-like domain-containing protein [Solibacillus sp. FSL H8-0538]|uniref:Ig-like domain-containing protein n=1 Tax=Solibacillus sp. FSL H8-0538 TaxID=2921400 RepID=UPI0030F4ECC9